jgi:cytochrome c-type biogenesis protein CcmH/NrfF
MKYQVQSTEYRPRGATWRRVALYAVLCTLYFAAAPLSARTPQEADRLYHEVGAQLFCICGCRENLLTCSMNVCSSKELERDYLRALSRDPLLDSAGIKDRMVERFGAKVLQVPPDSHIYPIIGVAVLLLAGAFGFGFWTITRRGSPAAVTGGPPAPRDDLDDRIERELKELE